MEAEPENRSRIEDRRQADWPAWPAPAGRLVLRLEKRGAGERELRFDEVRSAKTKMTLAKKLAIAAEVYAVLFAIGFIIER